MNATFAELVAEIRQRSAEEKGELLGILERELIASRRAEIAANSAEAQKEFEEGKVHFSSDISVLKRELA
jgi:hypothetical protein